MRFSAGKPLPTPPRVKGKNVQRSGVEHEHERRIGGGGATRATDASGKVMPLGDAHQGLQDITLLHKSSQLGFMFLAGHNSSIGDLVSCHSLRVLLVLT